MARIKLNYDGAFDGCPQCKSSWVGMVLQIVDNQIRGIGPFCHVCGYVYKDEEIRVEVITNGV